MDPPAVTLVPVDEHNYEAVLDLDVKPDQRGFVAPTVKSLAQAYVYREAVPLAGVVDGTVVGFVLLFPVDDAPAWTIVRFLVDAAHQRRGLGTALLRAVEHCVVERWPGTRFLRLTVVPENDGARAFYVREGFVETGEVSDGELVMEKPLGRR